MTTIHKAGLVKPWKKADAQGKQEVIGTAPKIEPEESLTAGPASWLGKTTPPGIDLVKE